MNALDHIILLMGALGCAALLDTIWLRLIRPHLALRYGWRAVHPSEHIPLSGWIGGGAFLAALILLLSLTGAAGVR